MTLPPTAPPMPASPYRPARSGHLLLVAAGLAAAVALLLCHAWLRGARPVPQVAWQAGVAPPAAQGDDWPLDGLLWEWPMHLAGAAGMYHCRPAVAGDAHDAVMVWTDSGDNIVAFGAVMEGVPWPSYAAALGVAGAAGPGQPIQIAERGHVVQVSAEESFVQLRDSRLACVRTWDD
jgi:hypothetical protein